MLNFYQCNAPFNIGKAELEKLRRVYIDNYYITSPTLDFIQLFTRQVFLTPHKIGRNYLNIKSKKECQKLFPALNRDYTLHNYCYILSYLRNQHKVTLGSLTFRFNKASQMNEYEQFSWNSQNTAFATYLYLYKLNNKFKVGDKVRLLNKYYSYYAGFGYYWVEALDIYIKGEHTIAKINYDGIAFESEGPRFPFYILEKV